MSEETGERRSTMIPQTEEDIAMQAASLLDAVVLPVETADVVLTSGRRCALETGPLGDKLTMRAAGGRILLSVLFTERGPLLSFESADIEVRSARALRLSAESVEIAAGSLRASISGDVEERISGERHTRIEGDLHLEAAAIQMQANRSDIEVRAPGRIALDGDHVGLNDAPCPVPFPWSRAANEEEGAQ